MENSGFKLMLLQTAFSCMASDGDIDESEIVLIKSLEESEQLFGSDNIEGELNNLVAEINKKGHLFLREYFQNLSHANLSEVEEIAIVKTAVKTIKADKEEKYTEIKFFKIIRSKLKVSDAVLIKELPEFENLEEDYLEQDIISERYIEKLMSDYFDKHNIPEFAPIQFQEKG